MLSFANLRSLQQAVISNLSLWALQITVTQFAPWKAHSKLTSLKAKSSNLNRMLLSQDFWITWPLRLVCQKSWGQIVMATETLWIFFLPLFQAIISEKHKQCFSFYDRRLIFYIYTYLHTHVFYMLMYIISHQNGIIVNDRNLLKILF